MTAVLSMLCAVVVYALYPVIAFFASGEIHPLVLIAGAQVVATSIQFVALFYALHNQGYTITKAFSEFRHYQGLSRWGVIQGLLNSLAHVSLMTSFIYVNEYAAALIYDIWPILMVVILPIFVDDKNHANMKDWMFIVLSAIGLFLIIEAKAPFDFMLKFDVAIWSASTTFGIGAALVAMVCMALTSTIAVVLQGMTRGALFVDAFKGDGTLSFRGTPTLVSDEYADICSSIAGSFVGHFFSMLISFSALYTWVTFYNPRITSSFDTLNDIYLFLAAGSVVAIGAIFFIYGNSKTKLPSINILYNLTPLVGLIFLYIFGSRDIIPSQVLLGGMLVIAANLAVSLRIELSASYYTALLGLCIAAVYCFFVPGMGMNNYYSAIAIPSGIFAILTAFMTERLAARQVQQEELAVRLVSVARETGEPSVWDATKQYLYTVFGVYSARTVEAETGRFLDAVSSFSKELRGLGIQLSSNRTRMFSFGEVFVLWLIGGCTLFLTVIGRPMTIESNLLAVVLVATISFLCFVILDPVNARRGRFLVDLLLADEDRHDHVCSELDKERRDFTFMSYTASIFALLLFLLFAAAIWFDRFV